MIIPLGLSWDTNPLLISYRNITLYNTGYIVVENNNHTPPTKSVYASCSVMNLGGSDLF